MTQLECYIRRDSYQKYIDYGFIPKRTELIVAYDGDKAIYKIGDGITTFENLKEITRIDELCPFFTLFNGKQYVSIHMRPDINLFKE